MLKQFFKDSILYGLTGLLSRGMALILVPIFTRVLATYEYGVLDYITIFATLVNLTIALEISQGVARYYTDVNTVDTKQFYASTALWFTSFVYLVFIGIAFNFSSHLTRFLLDSIEWEATFRVAVVMIALNGVFFLLQDLLRWQFRPKQYAVVAFLYTLVSAITSIVLVPILGLGVVGIFYGQIVGALVGISTSLMYSYGICKSIFSFRRLKEMLAFSLPLVPSSIAVFLSTYIDRISIKELLSLDDVGLYGIGFRFASIIGLLMIGFQSSLTPLIYKHYRESSTPNDLAKIFRVFLLFALPILLTLAIFSKEILWLFTTQTYHSAWVVIPALSLAIIFTNMYIFTPGLTIAKKTKIIAIINLIAAIFNLIFNLILIPILGILGAAIATLFSSVITFTMYLGFSQRIYYVPHEWRKIIYACLFTICAISLGLYFTLSEKSWDIFNILVKLILISTTIVVVVRILYGTYAVNLKNLST